MSSPPKRRRRTGAEVRRLMLEAALSCFAEKGYGRATTREIADRAGVSETLLFRHFSNKQVLFETAVLQPIDEFIEAFTASWGRAPLDADAEVLLERFVTGVYDLCHEHRELLLALPMDEVARPIPQAAFARLQRMGDDVSEHFGFTYDAAVAVRAAVISVAMIALFEQQLFPGAEVGRERIVAELTGLLVGGLANRPASAAERVRSGQ